MLLIVVVGWKAAPYIKRCLDSIAAQKEPFRCRVLLDPGDDTFILAQAYASDRFMVSQNTEQQYGLANIVQAIRELSPADDDIIITIDADDWLPSPEAFTTVVREYAANPDLLVTYGSWRPFPVPTNPTNNRPYLTEDFENLRGAEWRGSHLRTFKYKVWSLVKDEDLRDSDSQYFRVAWDLAFMLPILEMAGPARSKFMSEILYIYNQETPYGDGRMRLQNQIDVADYIRGKPPYSRLP